MPPLVVDPAALDGAGAAVIAVGDALAAAIGAVTFSFGVNTGQDLAGEMFGLAYQDAAKSLQKAAAAAVNAARKLGFMLEASAVNYSKAEAVSMLGGGAAVLPTPAQPAVFNAPGAPWTLGPGVPAPALWALVETFVGGLWPNGDPAGLRAAAVSWRTLGAAFNAVNDALSQPNSVIGAQVMPESGLMHNALSKLGSSSSTIGAECGKLAGELDGFAGEVQHAQDAIRDLLHRLGSVTGLWHEMVAVFEGDGLEELKKIANDIKAALHNMKREADARTQAIKQGMGMLDGAIVGLEGWARKELTHFLGDEVGNAVATAFDTLTNMQEGVLKSAIGMEQGLEQLNPLRAIYDPQGTADAWKGLGEKLFYADPELAPLHPQKFLDTIKEVVHADDWRTDRPGLGLGENIFDVGTLFAPGAGEAGAGAKAAAAGAQAAEEGADAAAIGGRAAGAVGDIGRATESMGGIGKVAGDLTKNLEQISRDLPKGDLATPGGKPIPLPSPKPGERPVGVPHSPVEPKPPTLPPAGEPETGELSETPAEPMPAKPGHLPASEGPPTDLAGVVPHPPVPVSTPSHAGEVPGESASGAPPLGHPSDLPTPPSADLPSGGHQNELPAESAPHGPGDDSVSHPQEGDQGSHHENPLDPNDLAALTDYTDEGYRELNDALRIGTVDATQQARVEALNEALEKLPIHDGLVLRGTSLPEDLLEKYQPGETIKEDAFTSATTNPAAANGFGGNVEFRILSRAGRDVSSVSMYPYEQEILFPSGEKFLVVQRSVDPSTGKTLIEMLDLGR